MITNIERLKKFDKDDILILFVPDELASAEYIEELRNEITKNEGIDNLVLILPASFDVKKLKFVGIDGALGDFVNLNTEDGTVEISFINPDSPKPEVPEKVKLVRGVWYGRKGKFVKYLGEEDPTVCPPDITTFDPGSEKKVFEDIEGKRVYLDVSEVEELKLPG